MAHRSDAGRALNAPAHEDTEDSPAAPGESTGLLSGLAGVLADLGGDLVCLCRGGVIEEINRPGLALLRGSHPTGTVAGLPFLDFVAEAYREVLAPDLAVLLEEPRGLPLPLRRLDGTAFEASITAQRLEIQEGQPRRGASRLLIHARDLHDKVRAVNTLVSTHKRFLRIVEQSISIVALLKGGRLTFINPTGTALLEASGPQELLNRPFGDFVSPDYRPLFDDEGLEALSAEDGMVPLILQGPGGVTVDIEARVTPFTLDGENAFMLEARDITARKQAAEGVRQREQRLSGILGHVGDGIFTVDRRGRLLSFNLAAEHIFQRSAAQVMGNVPDAFIPGFSDRFVSPHTPAAPRRGQRDGGGLLGREVELQGRRANGQPFPLTLTVTRLPQGADMVLIAIVRDITERKRIEERERRYTQDLEARVEERTRALRRLDRQKDMILDSAGDAILGFNLLGHVIFANPAAGEILGQRDSDLVGRSIDEVLRRRTRDGGVEPLVTGSLADPITRMSEVALLTAQDTAIAAEFALTPMEDEGRVVGAVAVLRDVTEQRKAQSRLRTASTILDNAAEGVAVCDAAWHLTMVNPAFCAITGLSAESLKGQPFDRLVMAGLEDLVAALQNALTQGQRWEGEAWNTRPDGTAYAFRLGATPLPRDDGQGHAALILTDITQRKQDEERIHLQATTDSLTGLANRSLFMDRLIAAVALARRSRWTTALLFVDLDGFKAINDTLGHDAGDLLLVQAADRLRLCARDSDTVARLGGDEFTLILNNLGGPEDAAMVANRVLTSLSAPFDLNGETGRISASIGVALVPDHALDPETLLTQADKAMYRAKQGGKAAWCLCDKPSTPPPNPPTN